MNLQGRCAFHADRIGLVLEATIPVEIVTYLVVNATTQPPSVPAARLTMNLRGLGAAKSVLSGSSVQLEIIHVQLVMFPA